MGNNGLLARFAYTTVSDEKTGIKDHLLNAGLKNKPILQYFSLIDEHFPVIPVMLEFIAHNNGFEISNPVVAEAYILGNPLLEGFWDYKTVEDFVREQNDNKRTVSFPKRALPHHNTWVRHVGLLKEEPSEEFRKNCLIAPYVLTNTDSKIIGESEIVKLVQEILNPFKFDVKKGDYVAVHRQTIINPLGNKQKQSLQNYGFLA